MSQLTSGKGYYLGKPDLITQALYIGVWRSETKGVGNSIPSQGNLTQDKLAVAGFENGANYMASNADGV